MGRRRHVRAKAVVATRPSFCDRDFVKEVNDRLRTS